MPHDRSCTSIIVAYNSGAELQRAVDSACAGGASHVVVIDNNSTDGAVAALKLPALPTRVVRLASNIGFAAAANLGATLSSTPYILFQNDDAFLKPHYIAELCGALESHPHCVSAQGKLLSDDSHQPRIDSAGIRLDKFALRPTDRGQGEKDCGQYEQPELIFGATGAAVVFRRDAFLKADGGFAADFFAYYEDVDLAWRLARGGWSHLYWPQAVAIHSRRGPQSKPSSVGARAFTNRYRTFLRNETPWAFARYAPMAMMWESARLCRIGLRCPRRLAAIVSAMPEALLNGWRERRL